MSKESRMSRQRVPRGGSFLLENVAADSIFTPEELNDEQLMMKKMTEDFIMQEVMPVLDEIEEQRFEHSVRLMRAAGELGLLGADVPEQYGGLGLDKISATVITESFSRGRSFALSCGAHVGIGTLPIVFYGTEEQKRKYLPGLASGEQIAAYALTEPSSGSDALSAKTTAKLSDCGQFYLLNGEKQWITNTAFADLFIVYAKVDGQDFSAFIVEKSFAGVSMGPEEQKMGIKGSSTRTLILEDAQVPQENLLGVVGKGHRIAFNILNVGRFKLAAGCVGSSKTALQLAIQYAKERKQFKTSIANFPLIKEKLASMAVRTYANESMVYRTAGLLEDRFLEVSAQGQEEEGDRDQQSERSEKRQAGGVAGGEQQAPVAEYNGSSMATAISEYVIECSINKVYGSETLDYVVDEALQIHGGYGYMSEYEVENIYRDSRINRIFEGTNEINRLLIPATLMRKALKGELPLIEAATGLQEELLMLMPSMSLEEEEVLARENEYLELAKKLFLMISGLAVQKYGKALEKEQEILSRMADMAISIYALESVILRTEKGIEREGLEKSEQKYAYARILALETMQQLERMGKECLSAMEEGDSLRTLLAVLRKLTRHTSFNSIQLKREIADRLIAAGRFIV